MKKLNHEGFSLVELLIAITISAIVMSCVIGLMGYGTHSMSRTQMKLSLQDEAKDAMKHISSYSMEASRVSWDDTTKALCVEQDTNRIITGGSISTSTKKYLYWQKGAGLYFAPEDEVDPLNLTADATHLLAEHVDSFICEVNTNSESNKEVLHITIGMKNDDIVFTTGNDIYLRNQ